MCKTLSPTNPITFLTEAQMCKTLSATNPITLTKPQLCKTTLATPLIQTTEAQSCKTSSASTPLTKMRMSETSLVTTQIPMTEAQLCKTSSASTSTALTEAQFSKTSSAATTSTSFTKAQLNKTSLATTPTPSSQTLTKVMTKSNTRQKVLGDAQELYQEPKTMESSFCEGESTCDEPLLSSHMIFIPTIETQTCKTFLTTNSNSGALNASTTMVSEVLAQDARSSEATEAVPAKSESSPKGLIPDGRSLSHSSASTTSTTDQIF